MKVWIKDNIIPIICFFIGMIAAIIYVIKTDALHTDGVDVDTVNMAILKAQYGDTATLTEAIDYLEDAVYGCPSGKECIRYYVSPQHTNPKVVYLDPTNLTTTCTSSVGNTPGTTKTGCMQWYVYAYDVFNYYAILDHNTDVGIAWNSNNVNTKMLQAASSLANLITSSSWDGRLEPRLISADEVAKMTGANKALEWSNDKPAVSSTSVEIGKSISSFYLDGYSKKDDMSSTDYKYWHIQIVGTKGNGEKSQYWWLFDNLASCVDYGCKMQSSNSTENSGYWTSSMANFKKKLVWFVHFYGDLSNVYVDDENLGIRPVIKIPKTIGITLHEISEE